MPLQASFTPDPKDSKQKIVSLYRQAVQNNIPLEAVQEKVATFFDRHAQTTQVEQKLDQQSQQKLKRRMPFWSRIFLHVVPAICVTIGIFLVGNAVWPIVSYTLFPNGQQANAGMLSPIPANQVLDRVVSAVTQVKAETRDAAADQGGLEVAPTVLVGGLDYTNLSNWFFGDLQAGLGQDQGLEYRLDIPSMDIENAIIKVGGTNLDRSLIQYPGTALPGQAGTPVIFGHSVLRQFYNPSVKNPRRYFSIFSKIMTLKDGEKIFITYDNVRYTYVVKDRAVVKPEDTYILAQQYDQRTLKLVTCVPEGTYQKRGIIIAELEKE